jgi:two-component system, NtrC family, sensor kinase
MKLSLKFALAFLICMSVVLALNAWLRLRFEMRFYEQDARQDQLMIGRALGRAVQQLWTRAGRETALEFVDQADSIDHPYQLQTKWLWIDQASGELVGISPPDLQRVRTGQETSWANYDEGEAGFIHTFVPVAVDPARVGGIVLSESLAEERHYTWISIVRTLIATASVVVVTGVVALVVGFRMVGRPMHELIRRAREIAGGQFGGRLDLPQQDEFGQLAAEINSMSAQLADAQGRIAAETSARIATIEQLRHADRLATVGHLASGVAHELGTPLNVIWARAKRCATDQLPPEEVAKSSQIIMDQSNKMIRLIRQLLDFARPRSPRRTISDLTELAKKTMSLLSSMADKRNVTMVLPRGEPVLAEVDPDQIQQVLSNLLMNGIQAMPHGGQLTVTIQSQHIRPPADHGGPADDYISFSVEDQGVGISEEDLPRVFEPFFTTKDVGEGTGLGLSVTRGIIREHGGWIGVTSRAGQGTCFAVYLPQGSKACAPAS